MLHRSLIFCHAHVTNRFVQASKKIIRPKARLCYFLPRVTYRKIKTTPGDNTQAEPAELSGTANRKLRKGDENYLKEYSKSHSLPWKKETESRDTVTHEERNGCTSRDGASVIDTERHRLIRTFTVSGQSGVGKTWFLSHSRRQTTAWRGGGLAGRRGRLPFRRVWFRLSVQGQR